MRLNYVRNYSIWIVIFIYYPVTYEFQTTSSDTSAMQTKPNVTTDCSNDECTNQLLKQLDEVRQDLKYANRTIGTDRISSRLSKRLNDIESAFEEYSIASAESHNSLNSSIEQILFRYRSQGDNNTTTDLADVVGLAIQELEANTSRLSEINVLCAQTVNCPGLAGRQANVRSEIDFLSQKHRRYMADVSSIQDTLQRVLFMDHSKSEMDNNLHGSRDTNEFKAEKLKSIIKYAKLALSDQMRDNSIIATSCDRHSRLRPQLLTNLSRLFVDSAHDSRVSRLIRTQLLKKTRNEHLNLTDSLLEAQLTRLLNDSTICFNGSRNTLIQLTDLRQSISSEEELESAGRSLLSESLRDVINLTGRQVELSERLSRSRKKAAELEVELDKLESLDHMAVIKLKNSTRELATKGSLVADWFKLKFVIKVQELTSMNTQISQVVRDEIAGTSNWTEIFGLAQFVDRIVDEIHASNETLADTNRALSMDNDLVQVSSISDTTITQELSLTKHSCLSLLDVARYSRFDEQARLSEKLLSLRHLAASCELDLEQTTSLVSETHDRLKSLYLFQGETRETLGIIDSQLSDFSREHASVIVRIGKLKSAAEQLMRNFRVNLTDQCQGKLASLRMQTTSMDKCEHNESLSRDQSDNIRLKLEKLSRHHAILQDRLANSFNLTSIRDITHASNVGTRQSLENLGRKVDHAHFVIDRIKLIS